MRKRKQITLKLLKNKNVVAIAQAGPKYSMNTNPNFPNIEIAEVNREIKYVTFEHEWFLEIEQYGHKLRSQITDLQINKSSKAKKIKDEISTLVDNIFLLKSSNIEKRKFLASKLVAELNSLQMNIERFQRNKVNINFRRLEEIRLNVNRLLSIFSHGPGGTLVNTQIILLEGQAGVGKTHYLCDTVKRLESKSIPCLLIYASEIDTKKSFEESLSSMLGVDDPNSTILEKLNLFGKKHKKRFVLFIDAINESDLNFWTNWLSKTDSILSNLPYLGVVVSYRSIDGTLQLNSNGYAPHIVYHPGFEGQEIEAQYEFFKYYEIDVKSLPLVNQEYANPLLLNLVCKRVKSFKPNIRGSKFIEITSGQKGLTYLYEGIVKDLGQPIENSLNLPTGFCWRFIKGTNDLNSKGVTGFMAESKSIWLTYEELLSVVREFKKFPSGKEELFITEMVGSGILVRIPRYNFDQKTYIDSYSLAYQWFADHLIARYLLRRYLDSSSLKTVLRDLRPESPIGSIFNPEESTNGFHMNSIATAIMTEFPERISKIGKRETVEISSHLSVKAIDARFLKDIFLNSLLWRPIHKKHFGRDTDNILEYYLKHDYEMWRHDAIDATLQVAIRSNNHLFGSLLINHLLGMKVPQLDLYWSEYLRKSGKYSPIQKLFRWFEDSSQEAISKEANKFHFHILVFCLASNSMELRDKASHALYRYITAKPEDIFELLNFALQVNDMYILERIVSIYFGALLNMNFTFFDFAHKRNTYKSINYLCKWYSSKLDPNLRANIVLTDSLRGIFNLISSIDPNGMKRRNLKICNSILNNKVSYKVGAISNEIKLIEKTLFGDFFNYTVGRTIPNRSNYDFNNQDYKKALLFIAKKMYQLGYREEIFGEIDREISNGRYRYGGSNEMERYAKKYAWQAYHIYYGTSSNIKDSREYASNRSYELKIDPTFPPVPDELPKQANCLKKMGLVSNKDWLSYEHQFGERYLNKLLSKFFDGKKFFLIYGNGRLTASNDNQLFFSLRSFLVDSNFASESNFAATVKLLLDKSEWLEMHTYVNTFYGEIPLTSKFGIDPDVEREISEILSGLMHPTTINWGLDGISSRINRNTNAIFIHPDIAKELQLRNAANTYSFVNNKGAILTRFFQNDTFASEMDGKLLYIREDAIKKLMSSRKANWLFDIQLHRNLNIARKSFSYESRAFDLMRQFPSSKKSIILLLSEENGLVHKFISNPKYGKRRV